jgi:hypothetical protein
MGHSDGADGAAAPEHKRHDGITGSQAIEIGHDVVGDLLPNHANAR